MNLNHEDHYFISDSTRYQIRSTLDEFGDPTFDDNEVVTIICQKDEDIRPEGVLQTFHYFYCDKGDFYKKAPQ